MMKKVKNEKIDVIKYFFTKVFSGILSFVSMSLYTYFIDPDIFGDYSLIIGFVNIIISIFIGWISSASLRYYSNYKNDKNIFFTNIIFDWIVMVIVSIIIILLSGVFIKNIPLLNYMKYVILIFIFMSTFDIFNSIFRAAKKTNMYFLIAIGQYIISLSLFIVLLKCFDLKLTAVFMSSIASYMVLAFVSIIYFKIYKYLNIKYISKDIQIKFLKYGLPMVGVWGTTWILNYSDRYIIKLFYSSYEVGLYDVASKLAENSINMLITSLSMTMMPILIDKYNSKGKLEAEKTHKEFLRYYFLLIIPAILGLIGIRSFIYGTLINKSYIEGMDIIIFISLSMFFSGFNQFLYKLWQLQEKTNNILIFMIISVVLNIILNILLLPKYGFIIASVTTLIANMVSSILALVYINMKKDLSVKIDIKSFIKIILSGVVMFLFVISTIGHINNIFYFVLLIILAVIIYGLMLVILGELKNEIAIFTNFIKRSK